MQHYMSKNNTAKWSLLYFDKFQQRSNYFILLFYYLVSFYVDIDNREILAYAYALETLPPRCGIFPFKLHTLNDVYMKFTIYINIYKHDNLLIHTCYEEQHMAFRSAQLQQLQVDFQQQEHNWEQVLLHIQLLL